MDEAFRTGEYVEIDGTMGTVEKFDLLYATAPSPRVRSHHPVWRDPETEKL